MKIFTANSESCDNFTWIFTENITKHKQVSVIVCLQGQRIRRNFVCLLTDLLNQLATAESSDAAGDGSETAGRSSAPGTPASSRRGSHSGDCQEIQPKYSQEQLEAVRKWVCCLSPTIGVIGTTTVFILLCYVIVKFIDTFMWYNLHL